MKPWAVIPVQSFARGKSRLACVMSDAARIDLARSLFEHVLDVALGSPGLGGVLVATDGPEAEAMARAAGADVLVDDCARPLSGVIDRALSHVTSRGARSALVFMSDLPHLRVEDVDELVAMLARFEMVVAPDLAEQGTNVLGLAPPGRMPTCFGNADSFARHCRAARERGICVGVHRHPRIGFDVDLPADLRRLTGHRIKG